VLRGLPGPDPAGRLLGHWTTLEPLGDSNASEVAGLDSGHDLTAAMGGSLSGRARGGAFAPVMAVRENTGGRVLGVVENSEMVGYPGVAVLLIYMDQALARPAFAMEALGLYIPHIFRSGAELIHMEVLEFNTAITSLLTKRGITPQARLRRQAYAAGHFWDMVIFAFDAPDVERTFGKFSKFLPGGTRQPTALGAPPDHG
jgi:hypothetical protein